jgi:hypothetical protein
LIIFDLGFRLWYVYGKLRYGNQQGGHSVLKRFLMETNNPGVKHIVNPPLQLEIINSTGL